MRHTRSNLPCPLRNDVSNYADASPIRSVGCTSEDWTAKEGSGPLAYRRRANDCAGMENSRLLEIAAGEAGGDHRCTQHLPAAGRLERRQHKRAACGCVQDEEYGVEPMCMADLLLLDGLPSQEEPHTTALGRFPVLGEHFQTIRAKPRQIFADRPREALAVPEMPATQDRMVLDDGDDGPGKIEQGLVLRRQLPLQPAPLVILIVGISVPLLGAPDLVTCTQHGTPCESNNVAR